MFKSTQRTLNIIAMAFLNPTIINNVAASTKLEKNELANSHRKCKIYPPKVNSEEILFLIKNI